MVVGEFTVSNISMEEDKREEEKNKQASTLDLEKFKADVDAAAALAKVRTTAPRLPLSACSTPQTHSPAPTPWRLSAAGQPQRQLRRPSHPGKDSTHGRGHHRLQGQLQRHRDSLL